MDRGFALCNAGRLLLQSALTNPRFGWDQVALFFRDGAIVQGIGVTLELTVICMVLGVGLGIVLAVMRISSNPVISWIARAYQGFFRGTPVLVQLLFWFNLAALYPSISFGIPGEVLGNPATNVPRRSSPRCAEERNQRYHWPTYRPAHHKSSSHVQGNHVSMHTKNHISEGKLGPYSHQEAPQAYGGKQRQSR
ncbi:glutamate/aspartate transport system permease protein GltK [Arthrobacter sp. Hiyo8]|nr:glutamate/aspartate transport system permease protein GltK [Arthrobacter sp. Hiyo8]